MQHVRAEKSAYVHRTAMDGTVEEHDIATSGIDADINVFIDENEDNITRILEEAVTRHA